MRERTKHTFDELKVRAQLALQDERLIEIVVVHQSPNGAQKAALMLGYEKEAYSVWALAALKRDFLIEYQNLPEIKNFVNI